MKRALYEIKTMVARYPRVAIPVARRRHGMPVEADTNVVIEGFPRSGLTFAVVAFTMSQAEPVRVAGRVHAPAQVIAAVRAGIPAMVLIREPEDVIPSFVVRHPRIGIRQAVRGYLRFYRPLLRYREGFVVGTFKEVTTDFGAVIGRVNERFGTSFGRFEHTDENVRRVWDAIDRDYRTRVVGGGEFDRIVARPSSGREEAKQQIRRAYESAGLSRARARARALYELFVP
jgi:hypothetical protein